MSSRLKILLVIEGTYPWYRGGVSEWIYQYISNFPGVDFYILQVATDQYLNSELSSALYRRPDNIASFIRIPPPDLSADWDKESFMWFRDHSEEIDAVMENCDIIHVANTGFAGWMGMKIAREHQKPFFLTEHALYWKEVEMGAVALECGYEIPANDSEKRKMSEIFKNVARQIYSEADQVVSVSKCNMYHQQKMGADHITYIPNGVSENWLTDEKKWNFENFTMGWIGRCAAMKNPLKYFEVVDRFSRNNSVDMQFIMMCCDANEPSLQKEVERKVKEYPQVEFYWNRNAGDYLTRMDALCITSHNESQPLVLFEAIAHKALPVGWEAGDVTSDFGLIVDQQDSVEDLYEQVMGVWNNRGEWQSLVEGLYRKLKKQHTWKRIFKQYEALFSSHLKQTADG